MNTVIWIRQIALSTAGETGGARDYVSVSITMFCGITFDSLTVVETDDTCQNQMYLYTIRNRIQCVTFSLAFSRGRRTYIEIMVF